MAKKRRSKSRRRRKKATDGFYVRKRRTWRHGYFKKRLRKVMLAAKRIKASRKIPWGQALKAGWAKMYRKGVNKLSGKRRRWTGRRRAIQRGPAGGSPEF
jgi:hypothetical protein